jgi:DUF4097 and DUF4098 domain-containing protein YvlB
MKTRTQLGVILSLAVGAAWGGPVLRREGGFWVAVEKGSEQVAPRGSIHIRTIGAVSAKSAAGDRLSYILIRRVKARSEAEARRRLSISHLRISHQGHSAYLVVRGGTEMADIEVTAPEEAAEVLIETRAGRVDATGFAGTVKIETGGGVVNIGQIGGDVVARTAGGDISLGQIGGNAKCVCGGGSIRAGSIRGEGHLETAGGDVVVQRIDGPLRCSTAGGSIHVAQAGNIVIADTAGGPIDVDYAKGVVTAKNSGGPIQVGSASSAQCESAGGAIRLGGGSFTAATAVGSIIARFQTQPSTDSFLSTSRGDITVWIPSNLRITVRAQSASYGGAKRIVSDFPDIPVKAVGLLTMAEGDLNGGGPLVRIAGSGGIIYLRRETSETHR